MEETKLPVNLEKYLCKCQVKLKNGFLKKEFSLSENNYGMGTWQAL